MNADVITLFVLIPLVTGLVSVAFINRPSVARAIGVVSMLALVVLGGVLLLHISTATPNHTTEAGGVILVSQMGGWKAPYGISLVFDSLSGLLIAAASVVALSAYLFAFSSLKPAVERRYFHPLIHLMMAGVYLSFLTGDLFNLFVAFEIMLMASYALLAIGATKKQLHQAYKYVLMNLLASTVFVMAAGMAYGMLGTLNMADMARIVTAKVETGQDLPTGFIGLAVLLLFVFALKGAFFPLWFWLPDTYHTCPIAIAGLFGGLLTKVGVYAVARMFPLIFAQGAAGGVVWTVLLAAAIGTMLLGALGSCSINQVRRILAISLITGVGFMIIGLAVAARGSGPATPGQPSNTALALTGMVFYMVQHMLVQAALFLGCGLIERHTGTDDLARFGGLHRKDLWLSVAVFVAAMSLVGLPPLSGFFGKLLLIQAAFADSWPLAVAALLASVVSLLAMLRVWGYGFWSPAKLPDDAPLAPMPAASGYLAVAILVIGSVAMSVFAGPLMRVARHAGAQLDDPSYYIHAVLGGDRDPDGAPGVVWSDAPDEAHTEVTDP